MVANRWPPSVLVTKLTAADAASAESFQALNEQMRPGARRPSGRYSVCSECIRLTVHDGAMATDQQTGLTIRAKLPSPGPAAAAEPGESGGTVAVLRPGDDVSGIFACARKDRRRTRSGAPYLALELRDHTGTIPARAFRDADALASGFERGDVVRVSGRVERFRDELVLEVRDIRRVDPER